MPGQAVLKFGGAALADGSAVLTACRIVADEVRRAGVPPVLVVSAHQGVTDQLEALARAAAASPGPVSLSSIRIRHRSLAAQLGLPSEPLDRFWRELSQLLGGVSARRELSPAELDLALSFGERLSARLVAWALERQGVPATPVDAWDLGLLSDSNHGHARPLAGSARSIAHALGEVQGVPVVTGFVAKDEHGRLTTLGRDGSDLTASLLAEALGAREVQFWKTVGGILSADPGLVPDAHVIAAVTYAEAAELAYQGARVLHPSSVAPALRGGVAVRVKSVRTPERDGTVLLTEIQRDAPVCIAAKREVLRIDLAVSAPESEGRQATRLFAALEPCGVRPGWIVAQGNRVSAYVEPGPGVYAALDELGAEASVARGLATLALVGSGVGARSDVGRRALAALAGAGIEVLHASLGATLASQAFAVAAGDLERAARVLHAALVAGPAVGPGARPIARAVARPVARPAVDLPAAVRPSAQN